MADRVTEGENWDQVFSGVHFFQDPDKSVKKLSALRFGARSPPTVAVTNQPSQTGGTHFIFKLTQNMVKGVKFKMQNKLFQ